MPSFGARIWADLLAETPQDQTRRMDADLFDVYGGHDWSPDLYDDDRATHAECDGAAADEVWRAGT